MSTDDKRDTGRFKSSAAAFDNLVEANLQLIRMLRSSLVIFIGCGVAVTIVTISSAMSLRAGQIETRDLIRSLDEVNCQRKANP